jgi:hypothetical protein
MYINFQPVKGSGISDGYQFVRCLSGLRFEPDHGQMIHRVAGPNIQNGISALQVIALRIGQSSGQSATG